MKKKSLEHNGEEEELNEIEIKSYKESDIISLKERISIGLKINRICSSIAGLILGSVWKTLLLCDKIGYVIIYDL